VKARCFVCNTDHDAVQIGSTTVVGCPKVGGTPFMLETGTWAARDQLRAALRVNGVIWSLPRPARHHVLVQAWCLAHYRDGEPGRIPEHEQGFVTHDGRFLDRYEAARLAGHDRPQLFSEDLW
jgi:hypothetical protein